MIFTFSKVWFTVDETAGGSGGKKGLGLAEVVFFLIKIQVNIARFRLVRFWDPLKKNFDSFKKMLLF